MEHRIDIFPADKTKEIKSYIFPNGIEAMNFLAKAKFNTNDKVFLLKYHHTNIDGKKIFDIVSQIETF